MDHFYYIHPNLSDSKIVQTLSRDFNAAIVDRTGNIDTGCVVHTPIPQLATTPSFNQLMDNRAAELCQYNSIDYIWQTAESSTTSNLAVIVAIIKHLRTLDNNKRPKFQIIIPPTLPKTRPHIFKFIQDNTDICSIVLLNQRREKSEVDIHSGHGDALMPMRYFLTRRDINDKPFEYFIDPSIYSHIMPIIDAMPASMGSKSLLNVMHWLNFVLTWQWRDVQRWILPNHEHDISFYSTDHFQQWCMNTNIKDKAPSFTIEHIGHPFVEYIGRHIIDDPTRLNYKPDLTTIDHQNMCTSLTTKFIKTYNDTFAK